MPYDVKYLDPIQNPIMTSKQVAEYLQVSRQQIYKLVRANEIPHFHVGALPRFHRKAIENLSSMQ